MSELRGALAVLRDVEELPVSDDQLDACVPFPLCSMLLL
jgi:hypothetical protein